MTLQLEFDLRTNKLRFKWGFGEDSSRVRSKVVGRGGEGRIVVGLGLRDDTEVTPYTYHVSRLHRHSLRIKIDTQ